MFQIPEGEPIFTPKERYSGERNEAVRIGLRAPNKNKESGILSLTKKEKIIKEIKEVSLTPEAATYLLKARADIREPDPGKTIAPDQLAENKIEPKPEQYFTDAVRLKVALDIEINLVVNGQKVHL